MALYFSRWLWPVLLALAALFCMPIHVKAANRIYFAGYLGMNIFPAQEFTDDTSGTGGEIELAESHNFAGAIGFKLTPQLRVEGEFSHMVADLSGIDISGVGGFGLGGDVTTNLAMINLYYDIDVGAKLKPFVGGGVGYAWHEGTINDISGFATDISESSSGYAWQVGGGARYPLGKNLALIGAYRYLDGQDLELGGYEIDYGAHEFRMGLSWDLPID